MKIIFCNFSLNNKVVDPDYEVEFVEANKNGFDTALISFEELITDNLNSALKQIKKCDTSETAIYRGWMLTPDVYSKLYYALKEKNILLINNPTEYKNCHYFPESYDLIKDYTPKSLWYQLIDKTPEYNKIFNDLKIFNNQPLIIKDYVKSQKHKWFDACFIKSANDENEIKRVTDNFIDLQDNNFEQGIVYREFIDFESIGNHTKSNMPITHEYRLFFLNGNLLSVFKYWSDGKYTNKIVDLSESQELENFKVIAQNIKSNFFTIDIAKSVDGKWYIVELGDGQVAGLPSDADAQEFYNKISCFNL